MGGLNRTTQSTPDNHRLHHERLSRDRAALRNERPDKIAIRPFVAEFTAKHAGMICQQVVHDHTLAFEAALMYARNFD